MSRLSPCHFHGDYCELSMRYDPYSTKPFCIEAECGARGPVAKIPEEAVEAWNSLCPGKEELREAWGECLGMTWGLNLTADLLIRMFERWYAAKYKKTCDE